LFRVFGIAYIGTAPDTAHAASLTERQARWFASVNEGLERETGRDLADWAEIARACPETVHRERLAWMKAAHGLEQNRASMVLNVVYPEGRLVGTGRAGG